MSDGLRNSRLVSGLGDPGGLFQPARFCDSVEVCELRRPEGTGKCGGDTSACSIGSNLII